MTELSKVLKTVASCRKSEIFPCLGTVRLLFFPFTMLVIEDSGRPSQNSGNCHASLNTFGGSSAGRHADVFCGESGTEHVWGNFNAPIRCADPDISSGV